MSKADLSAALRAGQFVVAPGLHDMIAAVISNEIGFDFVYASGFWLTASAYGLPDAGIATYHPNARSGVDAGANGQGRRDRRRGHRLRRPAQRSSYGAAAMKRRASSRSRSRIRSFPRNAATRPSSGSCRSRTWSRKSKSPAPRGAIPKSFWSSPAPTRGRLTGSRARFAAGSPTARLAPTSCSSKRSRAKRKCAKPARASASR